VKADVFMWVLGGASAHFKVITNKNLNKAEIDLMQKFILNKNLKQLTISIY